MKTIIYTSTLLLLFGLFSTIECSALEKTKPKLISGYPTQLNKTSRASPADSSDFSVQIRGDSNFVKINGKIVKSTTDTIPKKNSVQVSGEENTVNIIQNDQASEVSVSQKGNNNHVIITQKK